MKKAVSVLILLLSISTLYANGRSEDGRRPMGPPPGGAGGQDAEMELDFTNAVWTDVHGAGCQRSDPKSGILSDDWDSAGNGYYNPIAPQGDAIRIYNFARLVRDSGTADSYPIVDTNQTTFYDDIEAIAKPASPDKFWYGQDAQFEGNQPSYKVSRDGFTTYDEVTGLTWMRGPNADLSTPVAADKLTIAQAEEWVKEMNEAGYGGYSDWRIPSIKEQYSLILFSGVDVSGFTGDDLSNLTPFIDDEAFNFAYGDTDAGERIIDSQYLSTNRYIYDGDEVLYFGVNFADGRIKGYGTTMPGNRDKTFFVQLVRGNTEYGINDYVDNYDGTVTDRATGLMWSQDDSKEGMDWGEALEWVQDMNEESYLGYSDWRLPNAKELQSIVDYSHAPSYDGKPAIDTDYFSCTRIINEDNEEDFPWYWSGTTHAAFNGNGSFAAYVCFGRAMAYVPEITMLEPQFGDRDIKPQSGDWQGPPSGGRQGGREMQNSGDVERIVKAILADYDPDSLTEDDAIAILDAFKEKGIRPGPEMDEAIKAAGFNSETLRELAPPPDDIRGGDRPSGDGPVFTSLMQACGPDNFKLASQAVDGGALLEQYRCESKNSGIEKSIPLNWENVPQGTKSLAVVMYHYPNKNEYSHANSYLLLWGIDPSVNEIPYGKADKGDWFMGSNKDGNAVSYTSPCSKDPGSHEYTIVLFALSETPDELPLYSTSDVDFVSFMTAVENTTILGKAELKFTDTTE